MAFAFEIPVGGSRSEAFAYAVLHLTALAGGAAFSWALRDLSWMLATLTLLGLTLTVVWSFKRSASAIRSGRLAVDDRGFAHWSPASTARGDRYHPGDRVLEESSYQPTEPWRFIQPSVWGRVGQLAWVVLRVDGKRVILLSGADQCRDDQWRALCAWLRWLDRAGGTRRESLGNIDTRPKLP